jgi:hypothetical protein
MFESCRAHGTTTVRGRRSLHEAAESGALAWIHAGAGTRRRVNPGSTLESDVLRAIAAQFPEYRVEEPGC